MTTEWTDKFNPFNSDKLFAQIYKWKEIKRGEPIPPPTTVSIDPANVCDLACVFCNASYILNKNKSMLSKETLEEIAEGLSGWGVESVCVGGGGESLLNPNTGSFIEESVRKGIDVGVVTNGTQIHKNLEALSKCNWVGISVDAGKRETYKKIKGADKFDKVISNIYKLNGYSLLHNTNLNNQIGTGIKFLVTPENVSEIYRGSKIAKNSGCSNIHIRPVAPAFDRLDDSSLTFNDEQVRIFNKEVGKARKLEDDNFRVFGVTHKFGEKFEVVHPFKKCYTPLMTYVIMPPSGKGNFDVGFCCDRRGDDSLTLKGLNSIKELKDFWGSEEHWRMVDNIKLSECPRCTYSPHNQIYENAILKNKLSYQFI